MQRYAMAHFDEAEWVLVDAVAGDEGEEDWVVTDGDDGAVSGVFFLAGCGAGGRRPAYAAFGRRRLPDPGLSFLPPGVSVRSASHGLLLLRGPWSTYYVCNPATAQWAPLPRPLRPHPLDAALALVSRPRDPARFRLAAAIQVPGGGPTAYRFEVFCSETREWRPSAEAGFLSEKILPGSGVPAAGVAYWRTAAPAVVAYDPAADKVRLLPAPEGCEGSGGRWQLGEAGGRLCCACVTGDGVAVHALGPEDTWGLVGTLAVAFVPAEGPPPAADGSGEAIVCRERPWPVRWQSGSLEVVLWVDGRVVAVDLGSRRVREVRLDGEGPAPGCGGDYVAHIHTLAPVVLCGGPS